MTTYRTLCRRCERYALIGHAYRRWWRVARAVILRLADRGGNQPETDWGLIDRSPRLWGADRYQTLCSIVAITSPRVSVKRNLWFAWGEFTGQPRPNDMIRSTQVALDHYYATGEIRGPKTRRMAAVLRGDESVVVVDTWMARVLGVRDKQARNKSTQELAERVIHRVRCWMTERTYSYWTLAETQAAVWAGMIRTHYDAGKIPLFRVRYAPDDPLVPF